MIQSITAPPATENPLRTSRLNDSRDFRPEWDVASLNEAVSKSLLGEIRKLTGRRDPDPGQMIPVLLSAGGYGKTHLFGRLSHGLGDLAFFVFVGAISDPMRPLDHIRWNVVETLFQPRTGKPTILAEALAALFHPSIVEYIRQFPPAEAVRHQPLRRALDEGIDPVLEIASRVTTMQPFEQLADSAAAGMPGLSASVIRALVLGWSPHANVLRRWLRGESLTEEESALVGLEESPPPPMDVLKAIAAILQYRKPMVICCDQLDSILKDPEGPRQLSIQLMELLAAVPGQFIVLSCLEDAWEVMVRNQAFDAFKQRTRIFRLDFPNEDQALALLRNRLRDWPGRKPELGNLWPFEGDSVAKFTRDKQPTPRVLLQRCAEAFQKWDDGLISAPISIGGVIVENSLADLFRKEWEKELESIRQNPVRTPEHISEARLFASVKEVVAMAKSADGGLGGLQINGYKEGIIPSTAASPKYSARIEINVGSETVPVVVVVSKMNGGTAAFYFVNALEVAMKQADGLLLIHVRSDFMMGPGARRTYERLKQSGKLIVYSLDDHPATFQRLECALSLLDKAHSGDMQLADTTVTFDHCRRLILETQLISNLDLFTALASWHKAKPVVPVRPAAAPIAPKAHAPKPLTPGAPAPLSKELASRISGSLSPVLRGEGWGEGPDRPPRDVRGSTDAPPPQRDLRIATDAASTSGELRISSDGPSPEPSPSSTGDREQKQPPTPVSKSTPAPASAPLSVSPPAPAPAQVEQPEPEHSGIDLSAWAADKLALAAEKLTSWGQKVEPVNFEIGPSFVRLNIRPMGNKTTYKKVCNRAMDLKVNLGLEFIPLIGSYSYFFTIDIQSPNRRAVTLGQSLAQIPADKNGMPLVPLGLDVAGKAHWLNLADPTDCHLLVAGTTGSGKSEFLKSIVAGLASRLAPDQVQFMLVDPKRVTFNLSGSSPYLARPIAHDIESALPLVQACEQETIKRYQALQKLRLTDVGQLEGEERVIIPRIVLIIDEFANLMTDKESNKALTDLLKRIGSMSRAAGIHLVLATQRPDSTVVPMLVRSNLPGRIALQVDSEANSEMVLDSPDAAYLLGKGDMFYKHGGSLIRVQSPMVSNEELESALKIR